MKIVTHLDLIMLKKKIKSKSLAKAVGLSEQNISVLKTGRARGIRFSSLAAICNYLDCQPGDIFEFVAEDTDK
jgi:putative transcriptional regulator